MGVFVAGDGGGLGDQVTWSFYLAQQETLQTFW